MSIASIHNYKALSGTLATAGQPDNAQLREIAESGYQVVINLGLSDADYAVPDEQEILESYGVEYHHIPVSFPAPEPERYYQFAELLKKVKTKKTFIHCAANKRVSVFLALFDILENGVKPQVALDNVTDIWNPDAVWKKFVNDILADNN